MNTDKNSNFPKVYRKYLPQAVNGNFVSPNHLKKQSKVVDEATGSRSGVVSTAYLDRMSHITTPYHVFEEGLRRSEYLPCLAKRSSITEEYSWYIYKEVDLYIREFGSALVETQTALTSSPPPGQTPRDQEHNFVGIYCRNQPEWVVAQFACASYGFVYVPMYDTLGQEAMTHISDQTQLEIVFCYSGKEARNLLKMPNNRIRFLIILKASEEDKQALKSEAGNSVEVCLYQDFLKIGRASMHQRQAPDPDSLCTICYTSGSTGLPKGVTITHRQYVLTSQQAICMFEEKFICPTTLHYSYLPLAHSMEQCFVLTVILGGGRITFNTGGTDTILSDIGASRPTILATVPRVLTKLYSKVMLKLDHPALRQLVKWLVDSKRKQHQGFQYGNFSVLDLLLFRKIRNMFGGRLSVIICGSAPINPSISEFFRTVFDCPLLEGYGSTETSGVFTVMLCGDTVQGTVGSIYPNVEVKLVNDGSLDLPAASSTREYGEIWVRGATITKGYYKNKEMTDEAITPDGWLRTGDIGEWTETGALKIIDRYKNIFKLAQGEYVVPDKVESIYLCSPLIQQILLDGYSSEYFAVAIVCPDFALLRDRLRESGGGGKVTNAPQPNGDCGGNGHVRSPSDDEALCSNVLAKRLVMKEMDFLANKAGLKRFEQARMIHLTTDLMTIENNLLTPTMKTARYKARKHFADLLTKMYADAASSEPVT